MSLSGKIVYAPRGESGHANSRKVVGTWPKVIATERYLAITFDLVRRTSRSSMRNARFIQFHNQNLRKPLITK